jgi:hypothetical protein
MTEQQTPQQAWVSGHAPHASLAEALAAFQAELPKIHKGETAKVTGENAKTGAKVSYTYGYAGLDAVAEAILPVLGRHGLAIISKTCFDEHGNFMLEVSLVHEGGERETSVWPLPDPRRVGPQDLGSAITYGRRYLKMALTGTFPGGEDDDGAKAQASARDSWETAKPQRQQQDKPVSAPPAQKGPQDPPSDEQVLKWVTPLPTAVMDKALEVYDWLAGKDLHNRVVEMLYGDKPVKVTATDLVAGRIADEAMSQMIDLADIKRLQTEATNRGLMKVKVSETETLAEALYTAQELAAHAEAEGSDTQATLNDEQGD